MVSTGAGQLFWNSQDALSHSWQLVLAVVGSPCAATDTSTLAHLHVASALGSEFPESGHGAPQGKEYNCYLKICTWKSKKDLSSASPGQNTSQGSPDSKGKEIDHFSVGEMAKHLWPSLIHHA